MRALFGCLAVLLGAVSIALAARYGYKGADTLMDGLISAVVFGLIALCAFLFDAAAVRLWFMGHRLGPLRLASSPAPRWSSPSPTVSAPSPAGPTLHRLSAHAYRMLIETIEPN